MHYPPPPHRRDNNYERSTKARIASILEANPVCADCPSRDPKWAVFLWMGEFGWAIVTCRRCAQLHYYKNAKLQPSIKYARNTHEWRGHHLELLETSGNALVNEYLQAKYNNDDLVGDNKHVVLPQDRKSEDKRRKKFLKRKYQKLKYCLDWEGFQEAILEKREQVEETKLLLQEEEEIEDDPLSLGPSTHQARQALQQIVQKGRRNLILSNQEFVQRRQSWRKPPPSAAPPVSDPNSSSSVSDFLWKSMSQTLGLDTSGWESFWGTGADQTKDDDEDDSTAITARTSTNTSFNSIRSSSTSGDDLLGFYSERSDCGSFYLGNQSERSITTTTTPLGNTGSRRSSKAAQLLQSATNFDDLIANYMKTMDGSGYEEEDEEEEKEGDTCSTSHFTESIPEEDDEAEQQDKEPEVASTASELLQNASSLDDLLNKFMVSQSIEQNTTVDRESICYKTCKCIKETLCQ